ncbi:hypothetical protein [Bradyrhizobium sp. SZCCHNS2002]|uniref:hypothetical protein n=1 Tax=Bradyrhizobium sp. SZCCHNS2002 TaxID=3057302 RepID=UPI0029164C07|nr:hypothetical protein [Bradyrhizobium sp. SZCCHNS2002]
MDQKFWGEKAVELFRLYLGNAWSKGGLLLIGGGVSVLAGWIDKPIRFVFASIWPSTPQSIWTDTPERIGWSLIGLGIVLIAIGSYKKKPVNPNDITLIGKFRKIFTVQQVDFLATHNFHDNWHDSMITDIQDVADSWGGAQFEFVDKKLNGLLTKVKRLSREFADQENLGFNVQPGGPTRTMKTNADRNGLTTETQKRINDLNVKSRNLANAVNELERVARRRMPAA